VIEQAHDRPPFWEWVVGFAGLVLVVAAFGYLVLEAMHVEHVPPAPQVEVAEIRPIESGGYVVAVRVRNRSASTAAGLKIEGSLVQSGRTIEQGQLDLPYLPGHSTREGGMFFTRDPRAYSLQLHAKGYEKP
jgi:uncharacterized protein (TIGR02588 family)